MINYFLLLFTKEKYIDKNKRINSFFKSDKKEIISEKKINSISSHILKHQTNYQFSERIHFSKLYNFKIKWGTFR